MTLYSVYSVNSDIMSDISLTSQWIIGEWVGWIDRDTLQEKISQRLNLNRNLF